MSHLSCRSAVTAALLPLLLLVGCGDSPQTQTAVPPPPPAQAAAAPVSEVAAAAAPRPSELPISSRASATDDPENQLTAADVEAFQKGLAAENDLLRSAGGAGDAQLQAGAEAAGMSVERYRQVKRLMGRVLGSMINAGSHSKGLSLQWVTPEVETLLMQREAELMALRDENRTLSYGQKH